MKRSIWLQGVAFRHADAVALLDSVDLRLEPGWYGVVGDNGAGKTTLLRLLTGDLAPAAGRVLRAPASLAIARCSQDLRLDDDVRALAARDDGTAHAWLGLLSLDASDLERWPTLSPGERRRWQIAAALATEPDVLLLDEPTNHVDGDARVVLIDALRRFRGIGVVVSHDRALLEALTRTTIRVHAGSAVVYPAAYGAARALWEAEADARVEQRQRAADDVARARRQLGAARRVRAEAERGMSAHARMRNPNDHDARGMGAKNLAAWAEARAGRVVGVRRGQVERAQERLDALPVDERFGGNVHAAFSRSPRERIAAVVAPELRRGDRIVLRDVHALVSRDSRIRLVGPNGSGKSTLLEALHASAPEQDRVLYLAQELSAADSRELLALVRSLPRDERGRVLHAVAALGLDPDRLLASASPSPGEARKLKIALGIGRGAWALLLDEPTNHLDLGAVERLEAALASYPGAIVVATHDRDFVHAALGTTWAISESRLSEV